MDDLIQRLGKNFEAIIAPILDSLRIEGVGPFLALVVISFAILVLIIFLYKSLSFRRKLRNSISFLAEYDDEKSFTENFASIDEYFSETRGLSHCWREFSETLIHPKGDDETEYEVIRNTSRPQEFFIADEAGYTTPFLKIFPNIFVGIGLVLTFAGLIAALSEAVTGMDQASAEAMQKSIVSLLIVTSAKFYTSIMALGSSIILSLIFRFEEAKRDRLFVALNERLENGFSYLSIEEMAREQVLQTQQQTKALEQFNMDLAQSLGTHIRDAINESMEPVVRELTDMGAQLGQNNLEAMAQIGTQIADNVQGAAGESLHHLSDRLDQLTTVLGDMSNNLSQSTGEFQNDIAAALENMRVGMEGLGSDLQNNARETSDVMSEKLESLAESLSEAANGIRENLMNGANNVSEELNSAITNLTQATEGSAENIETAVEGISEAVQNITDAFENASSEAAETTKEKLESTSASIAESFKDAGKKMSSELENGISTLSNSIQGFEKNLKNSEKSFTNINDSISKTASKIEGVLKSLEKGSDAIEDSTKNIKVILTPALQAAEKIKKATDDTGSLVSNIKLAIDNLKQEMTRNSGLWENHSKYFDQVNERLGKVFLGINKQIEESHNRMTQHVNELDSTFGSAVTSLAEAVEELQEERRSGIN